MKNIEQLLKKNGWFYMFMLILLPLTSCDNEFRKESLAEASGPPIITSVSEAQEDAPVTQGVLDNTYIIRGKNLSSLIAIYFNGQPAGFNPALVTNEIAFVRIPTEAPYVGQSNTLRLENLQGFTEYDFSLLTIEGFSEETIDGVKTVTLTGGDFTDTASVTFVSGTEETGDLVERPASIISISETQVKVEVPDGVEQAYIYIQTSRGAVVQSDSYGFSYSIYIDALNPDWTMSQWGGTFDVESTENALGQYSIKSVREGWSGLSFLAPNIDFDEYESLTVSIYGVGNIVSVNLAINDFDAASTPITLTLSPGEWKKFVIPLADLYPNGGEPNAIFRLDFQESSNTGLSEYIFYVDDFGFL
ncbi:hypothetical protein [Gelidibacter mesophilus]|uniref:hypothetical protein n=1 Tax=Gelidibacter mesophilus TaxID=169050 RepID=UPI000422A60B|nr:hypothetical protein [Gelidibacter mesophilus]